MSVVDFCVVFILQVFDESGSMGGRALAQPQVDIGMGALDPPDLEWF
jgi:hypothetical protein